MDSHSHFKRSMSFLRLQETGSLRLNAVKFIFQETARYIWLSEVC